MAKVDDKLAVAQRAVATLRQILEEPKTVIVRDAAVQRFEYSFEACWKTLKVFLDDFHGVSAASPKSTFREALTVGLLTPEETEACLEMTNDRNATSHTYLEEVAEKLYSSLPPYLKLLERLLDQIAAEL